MDRESILRARPHCWIRNCAITTLQKRYICQEIHTTIYFEQKYYTRHRKCRLRIFAIIRAPLRKVKEGKTEKTGRKLRRKRREKTDRGRDPKTVSSAIDDHV